MLTPHYAEGFKKQFKKLPLKLQNKFLKQLKYLLQNSSYPSLHAKKQSGTDKYEARVDFHYRFTYHIYGYEIWLLTIGPHDEGLGKK